MTRKWIVGIMLIGSVWMVCSPASSNPYLMSRNYETIKVKTGDTIWEIAAKRVSSREDIRELIVAIRDVNSLDGNAALQPGQTLRVPLKVQP